MARRTRLLACLALISTLLLAFILLRDATASLDQTHHPYNVHDDEPSRMTTHSVQAPLPVPAPAPKSEWCHYNDCLRGKWAPREPPFKNLEEFQKAYKNNQVPIWSRAPIPSPSISGLEISDEERKPLEEQRLVDLMNYIWVPTEGKTKKWDPEEFVVRMLRTPGGLILLGDSISQQHSQALGYSLRAAGIPFDHNPPHLPLNTHKNIHQHVLRPNEPTTRRLLERAGVPESRLLRPVITMVEDHMLLHEKDIRAITEQLGASPDYFWYHDFQRVEDWDKFVKNAARPRAGEESSVTEDTILVMNAGAHWCRHELAMLPDGNSDQEEQSRVTAAYRQMMNLIVSRIGTIPQLSVIYRATAPGHPNCNLHTKPYHDSIEARAGEQNLVERLISTMPDDEMRQFRRRWDWDLYQSHNRLWEQEIARLNTIRDSPAGAKWIFMDIFDQALQRPDAHTEPGTDCLHWNLPVVIEQWTDQIFHILFLEMERKKALASS